MDNFVKIESRSSLWLQLVVQWSSHMQECARAVLRTSSIKNLISCHIEFKMRCRNRRQYCIKICKLNVFLLLTNIDQGLELPSSYPSGCLLGCVTVEDCLERSDYIEQVNCFHVRRRFQFYRLIFVATCVNSRCSLPLVSCF